MARAFLIILILAFGAPAVDAAANAELTVVVRTYSYGEIEHASIARARAEADAIFLRAGIALRWRDCRVRAGGSGAACVEQLEGGRDFLLKLVDSGPQASGDTRRVVPLGVSMLDWEQRVGVLMTIDLSQIRAIAESATADAPTLLGRAVAHEIGHLLLGSNDHSRSGLMRALWSQDELRGIRPAGWEFSAREAAQMRHGLMQRTRAAN